MVAARLTLDLAGALTFSRQYDGLNRRTLESPSYPAATYYMHSYYDLPW